MALCKDVQVDWVENGFRGGRTLEGLGVERFLNAVLGTVSMPPLGEQSGDYKEFSRGLGKSCLGWLPQGPECMEVTLNPKP